MEDNRVKPKFISPNDDGGIQKVEGRRLWNGSSIVRGYSGEIYITYVGYASAGLVVERIFCNNRVRILLYVIVERIVRNSIEKKILHTILSIIWKFVTSFDTSSILCQ